MVAHVSDSTPHSDHYVRAMESTAHRKEVRAGTLQAAREYADRENLTTGHVVRFANAYLSDALTYIDSIEEQLTTAQARIAELEEREHDRLMDAMEASERD